MCTWAGGKEGTVDYIIATEDASLAWLANLACIELHQMHVPRGRSSTARLLRIDLDPPEEFEFQKLVSIALDLKDLIEKLRLPSFVKGRPAARVCNIVCRVSNRSGRSMKSSRPQKKWPTVCQSHSQSTTMCYQERVRKGRVLIDIYRNRTFQSILSAYSARGIPGAPVSMPLQWDD